MADFTENNSDGATSSGPAEITVSDTYARGAPIPWWSKMLLKLILSRLPVSYLGWTRLGIFRHGDLASSPADLYKQITRFLTAYNEKYDRNPRNILELGPGDSIANLLFAHYLGIEQYYFVDAGDFATREAEHYLSYKKFLEEKGHSVNLPISSYSRENVLGATGGKYLTYGLKSLKSLPSDILDYSFSQAVFEHIKKDEFADTMQELFRLHKPGSFSRHWVDLHDHLGGGAQHLRFSPKFWERPAIWNSGFYTNRLMMHEMIKMAEDAGFEAELIQIHRWPPQRLEALPLAKEFRSFTDKQLNVCTFLLNLHVPQSQKAVSDK